MVDVADAKRLGCAASLAHVGALDQLAADPIFVGGHVRSGTTWAYDLLTGHDEVAGAFETWVFAPNHGVGGVFSAVQWDLTRQRAGPTAGLSQLVDRERVAVDVRQLVSGWFACVLEPQHRFLVEKTPTHLLGMKMISEVFPRARFIHVVRDGRDVAVSLRAAAESWNPGFAVSTGRLFTKQAETWSRQVRQISKNGAELGDRYLEIRYEDIQRAPVEALSRMYDFCGIPYDSAIVTEIVEANSFSRYKSGEDAFRRKGQVGDWRNHFTLLSAALFARNAGSMLIEKGYETDRRWWLSFWRRRSRPGVVSRRG